MGYAMTTYKRQTELPVIGFDMGGMYRQIETTETRDALVHRKSDFSLLHICMIICLHSLLAVFDEYTCIMSVTAS